MAGPEYFAKIARCHNYVVSDDVQFVRHDWMNRNRVRTPEGWTWITLPVVSTSDVLAQTPVKWTRQWADKTLRTLRSSYSKAPHFSLLEPVLEWVNTPFDGSLAEAGWWFTAWACNLFAQTHVVRATSLGISSPDPNDKIAKQGAYLGCDVYITGRVGWLNYVDEAPYAREGIKVVSYRYAPVPYKQRWDEKAPFEPHLSVIDMLAMLGVEQALATINAGWTGWILSKKEIA